MNLRRLVIPLIAVLAIVALAAAATTTLVVASPQQSPSSQAGPTPVPDIVLVIPPEPTDPPEPKESMLGLEDTEPKAAPKVDSRQRPQGEPHPARTGGGVVIPDNLRDGGLLG